MYEMMLPELVNVLYFLLTVLVLSFGFRRVMVYLEKQEDTKRVKSNKKLIETFDHIHAVLTFHMDRAFETVHQDNILIYSLEGTKPSEDEINALGHEFVKLTLKLSGPNIVETFIDLYGDEDTLFFVMLDYFNRRFEEDEIRAQAVENIQNTEDI